MQATHKGKHKGKGELKISAIIWPALNCCLFSFEGARYRSCSTSFRTLFRFSICFACAATAKTVAGEGQGTRRKPTTRDDDNDPCRSTPPEELSAEAVGLRAAQHVQNTQQAATTKSKRKQLLGEKKERGTHYT